MKVRGKTIGVRIPVPPPTRVKNARKGNAAYNRSDSRRMERQAKEGRDG